MTKYYKNINIFTKIKIISKTTDFMLISKRVRDEYIKISEYNKNIIVPVLDDNVAEENKIVKIKFTDISKKMNNILRLNNLKKYKKMD